jgi:hypothetical protein
MYASLFQLFAITIHFPSIIAGQLDIINVDVDQDEDLSQINSGVATWRIDHFQRCFVEIEMIKVKEKYHFQIISHYILMREIL